MNLGISPVCVIGAGAVGCYLAARLAPRTDTWLLASDRHRSTFDGRDLTFSGAENFTCPAGSFKLISAGRVAELPEGVQLWVCTKAYDLERALTVAAPALKLASLLTVFCNGLGVAREAEAALEQRVPVMRALLSIGLRRESPTHVAVAGALRTAIAARPEHTDQLLGLRATLTAAGSTVTTEPDPESAEWRKALVNLAVNPICSLVGGKNGVLMEDPALTALARTIFAEVRRVAGAEGIDLSTPSDDRLLESIAQHAANVNSMLSDLRAGRRTENEYLLGRLIEYARDHGISVPAAGILYPLVAALERHATSEAGADL